MKRFEMLFFLIALYSTQIAVAGNHEAAPSSCMLNPPQNFNAVFTAPTTALFTWDTVANALGYKFNITIDGVPQGTVLILIGNSYSYSFPAGDYFDFTVQALCETGEGPHSRRLYIHEPLNPIITVDELVQRDAICKTPNSTQIRDAGASEVFIINKPQEGISEVRSVKVERNINNSNKPWVSFVLWAESTDNSVHYERIATYSTPGGQLTQMPPGDTDWATSSVQFLINNAPFFYFTAMDYGDFFEVTMHYQLSARVATCTTGKPKESSQKIENQNGLVAEPCMLFPNPAKDQLNIVLNDVPESNINIRITDLSGRILYDIPYTRQEGFSAQHLILPINDLSPGFYLVSATSGNWQVQKTFVKTE